MPIGKAALSAVCVCLEDDGAERCAQQGLEPKSLRFRRAVRRIAYTADVNAGMLLSMLLAALYGDRKRMLRVPPYARPEIAVALVELFANRQNDLDFVRRVCHRTGDSAVAETLFGSFAVERALAN